MTDPTSGKGNTSGLWAYAAGKFYALTLEPDDKKTDHVAWFRVIGLPDYGHAYDRILRGRMMWNRHFEHYLLTFYGIDAIPNKVYSLVTRFFNAGENRIVERRVSESWDKL